VKILCVFASLHESFAKKRQDFTTQGLIPDFAALHRSVAGQGVAGKPASAIFPNQKTN
jgi:hypothetical protein